MLQAKAINVNLLFSTTIVAFGLSFLYGYNIGVLNQPKQVQTQISSLYAEILRKIGELCHFTPSLTSSPKLCIFDVE